MANTAIQASVVIPCRNSAGTIGAAVRTALAQSVPPLEVIVVDDASTDDSAAVAAAAGARVERLASRGNAGGARNRGIEVARGDVLAFLDADVEIAPDWLALVQEAMAADPDVVAVGGRIVNGRPGLWGDLDYFLSHSEWMSPRAKACGTYPTMAVAYRRRAVGESRFPAINWGEDTFFALAVQARGGKVWYEPRIRIVHKHERLDRRRFWERQVDMGRTLYWTRRHLDRPGRILFRFPVLLLLYPHLWIVLLRMVRAGLAVRALALFPWLVAGETARIVGFFHARADAGRGVEIVSGAARAD
ncbi:MAG: glycosyltransferase family 2 protein [Acidobacteriota bacterium]